MADKAARGTKRTCQNGSCGSRFYDLGRDPIVCPICGSVYAIAHGAVEPEREERRPVRPKPEPVAGPAPEVEVEGDDALAEVEGGDEAIGGDDDDTFLEEEEDGGGDVTDIVGGGGGDEDES